MNKDITKRQSKSKYSVFITCPKQYWFSQVSPTPFVPSPAMERGTELHDLFEEYYKLPESQTIKDRQVMKFKMLQLPNASKYVKEIDKFIKWTDEKCNFIPPESCEQKIYDEQMDIVIKWDRVDYDGSSRIIWDYKTGQKHPVADFRFELGLYAMIFQKNTGKRVDYVGIYFVDHGIQALIKVDEAFMIEIVDKVNDLNTEMRDYQRSNVWPTKMSYKCGWCNWKEECPTYMRYKR